MFCFVFSTCFLSFSLFKQGPASKTDAAGSACRGRLFAPNSPTLGIDVPFWYSGLEPQLGPLSLSSEETLRETWFSFEVSLAAFKGLGAFSHLLFFCTSCASVQCQCTVCRCASPAWNRDLSESLGWGLSWVECASRQRGGQPGEEEQPPSRWPSAHVPGRRPWLGLRCREAAYPRRSGVPVTRRPCGRIICTWGCDNTNVDVLFHKSSEMFAK